MEFFNRIAKLIADHGFILGATGQLAPAEKLGEKQIVRGHHRYRRCFQRYNILRRRLMWLAHSPLPIRLYWFETSLRFALCHIFCSLYTCSLTSAELASAKRLIERHLGCICIAAVLCNDPHYSSLVVTMASLEEVVQGPKVDRFP